MHTGDNWMKLRSHEKDLSGAFARPFPVGVEYYRPPTPLPEFWDEDFRRISGAGMSIVRAWYCWNWVETMPNVYEFDDLDLLFDTAARHGLKIWVDSPFGTHMACPAWMLREHPEMRVMLRDGNYQQDRAGAFAPHGAMTHNFDHPMWRVYTERYLRQFVPRYKDHEAMGIWGTWDGISTAGAWTGTDSYPPYIDYTIAKYKDWLYERFSLDGLNKRLLRRYRSWEDVDAPRSKDVPVEFHLWNRFHYENMADHLGWMADLIDQLDGGHEQRSHGGSYPAARHELISPFIDSWGLSHHASNRLTSDDPYSVGYEAYGFHWCRQMGRGNRWWNEEIYSNFVGGLHPVEKKTIAQESALMIWLTLIEGGAGAMFWQYRPEYMTYEAPGLSIAALDGEPTERFVAARDTIAAIARIEDHLPLAIPQSDVAIAYSGPSDDQFDFNDMSTAFVQRHRAMYSALWPLSISPDLVTPTMDWSGYQLVYLPNFALLDDVALAAIRPILESGSGPHIVADGYFGTFSEKGHWSWKPPHGLGDLISCRIADFDVVNSYDTAAGRNIVEMECGRFEVPTGTTYYILEPQGDWEPVATINGDVAGVRSADGRFTWYSFTLGATSSSNVSGQPTTPAPVAAVHPDVAAALLATAGVAAPMRIDGDRVVAYRRSSCAGGSLIFLINVEDRVARTRITPGWPVGSATDLVRGSDLPIAGGAFATELGFGEVVVIHCTDG